ncbi:MAG: hypothetical protein O2971_08550 [Proteobacteria bacterium]|nr:hypothetical protein [Pseudomonadota bacterium]
MENLLAGLEVMFFNLEIVNNTNNENPVLVFSVACAIIGAFAVVLDFIVYHARGASLLKLRHGWMTLFFLFGWSFGALVVGWIGQVVDMFLVSISAAILVGFSWPILLTKWLEERAEKEQQEEPEQELVEEV